MESVLMKLELDIKRLLLNQSIFQLQFIQLLVLKLDFHKKEQNQLKKLLPQHHLPQSTNMILKLFITKNHSMESVLMKLELDIKRLLLNQSIFQLQFIQLQELKLDFYKREWKFILLKLKQSQLKKLLKLQVLKKLHQLGQSTNMILKLFITKNHSMESVLMKLELDIKRLLLNQSIFQLQFIQQQDQNLDLPKLF